MNIVDSMYEATLTITQYLNRLLAPLLKDGEKPSSSALTKHLLSTLSDEANPITHSDIYSRTGRLQKESLLSMI
jgi:hypothetical protein